MALPSSPNTITAAMINVELGRASNAPFSLNDSAVRALAGKPSGAIAFSDFWGKSSVTPWAFTKISGNEDYPSAEGSLSILWSTGEYSIGNSAISPPTAGRPSTEYGNIGSTGVSAGDVEVKLTKIQGKNFSAYLKQYSSNYMPIPVSYTMGTYVSLSSSYIGFIFDYTAYAGEGIYQYDITIRRKSTGQTMTRRITVYGE